MSRFIIKPANVLLWGHNFIEILEFILKSNISWNSAHSSSTRTCLPYAMKIRDYVTLDSLHSIFVRFMVQSDYTMLNFVNQ